MLVQQVPPLTLSHETVPHEHLQIETISSLPIRVEGMGDLRALAVLENGCVWIGGTQGVIAKSEDGGQTWSLCSLPSVENLDLDVRALCLQNSQIACAMCSSAARIYRTVDGGKNWSCTLTPQKEDMFFNSMAFWDEKNGILLGDPVDGKFILFSTQDGGESWKELSPLQMPSALDGEIGFAASNSCLTIQGNNHVWFGTGGGSSARIFYSSDRGIHWNVTETPMQVSNSSSGIFSVAFCNENIGIAVGGDYQSPTAFSSCNIITTKDGGRNWQPFHDECFAGKYLSSVVWKSENSAVVVDGSGKVFNSVAITNDRGWAVGPNQNFAKF